MSTTLIGWICFVRKSLVSGKKRLVIATSGFGMALSWTGSFWCDKVNVSPRRVERMKKTWRLFS